MRGWDAEYGKARMRDAGSETIFEMDAGIWNDEGRDSLEVAPFLISHRSSSIPHPFRIPHPHPASALPRFLHPDPAFRIGSKFRIPYPSRFSPLVRPRPLTRHERARPHDPPERIRRRPGNPDPRRDLDIRIRNPLPLEDPQRRRNQRHAVMPRACNPERLAQLPGSVGQLAVRPPLAAPPHRLDSLERFC